MSYGARDGGRTRIALRPRDFLHTSAFAAGRVTTTVRALDYAFTVAQCATGAPRLVSTPSHCWAWLGVAAVVASLPMPHRGFAEFEGIHAGAFASRCSIFKSLVSTNFTTRAVRRAILPERCACVKSPVSTAGTDILNGGAGNDTYEFNGAFGPYVSANYPYFYKEAA